MRVDFAFEGGAQRSLSDRCWRSKCVPCGTTSCAAGG